MACGIHLYFVYMVRQQQQFSSDERRAILSNIPSLVILHIFILGSGLTSASKYDLALLKSKLYQHKFVIDFILQVLCSVFLCRIQPWISTTAFSSSLDFKKPVISFFLDIISLPSKKSSSAFNCVTRAPLKDHYQQLATLIHCWIQAFLILVQFVLL